MKQKKIALIVLWFIVGILTAGSIYFYITLPHWKGIYIGGMGAFLIVNLLVAIFFINKNFKS